MTPWQGRRAGDRLDHVEYADVKLEGRALQPAQDAKPVQGFDKIVFLPREAPFLAGFTRYEAGSGDGVRDGHKYIPPHATQGKGT
jgi:hypothetical protein